MAIYDECDDIYREYMEPYLKCDCGHSHAECSSDDDHLIWQGLVKAIKTYVEKNYPDTPYLDCWHCKESLPHTPITYDSGVEVTVCVVCGFAYEPKEAN